MRRLFLSFALAALAAAPALAHMPAPKVVSISALDELQTPLPYPYNPNANANADVNAAFARAKAEHKRVLIDLGGNWCGDCRVLAGVPSILVADPGGKLIDRSDVSALADARSMTPQALADWLAQWAR